MESCSYELIVGYLTDYILRNPASRVQDLYKLLYQAFHGSEHAVLDEAHARRALTSEWSSLKSAPGLSNPGSLLEPIHIEDMTPPLYRLHLVPAISTGVDPETILGAFMDTARSFPKSNDPFPQGLHQGFVDCWNDLRLTISIGKLRNLCDLEEYEILTSHACTAGWPAVHHSNAFRRAYDPHYRLVMKWDSEV